MFTPDARDVHMNLKIWHQSLVSVINGKNHGNHSTGSKIQVCIGNSSSITITCSIYLHFRASSVAELVVGYKNVVPT